LINGPFIDGSSAIYVSTFIDFKRETQINFVKLDTLTNNYVKKSTITGSHQSFLQLDE